MKLENLIKELDAASIAGGKNRDVTGVACDSRQVRPGYLFVAVQGRNNDGWLYVNEAVERGAVAIVSEHEPVPGADVCHVRVADSGQALSELANAFYQKPSESLKVVGVTGTNGKTTVSYVVRDMLEAAGLQPGLIGTVEYRIGARSIPAGRTTPEAPLLHSMLAQMKTAGCRSAVMEVSSHALVQKRTSTIDYDVGVFTNLTRDHLDYHETMDQYFEAKTLLFAGLGTKKKKATAVLNSDDQWGCRIAELPGIAADRLTFSTERAADVKAEDIVLSSSGSSFNVLTPWGHGAVRSNLLGRFNVSNLLAAIAACGALGVSLDVMIATVAGMVSIPGRLEEVPTRKGFQVFVDYAHTDDALEHVLKTLREITRKRLMVVFGCGGNRDRTKRAAMGKIAATLADRTIVTSDNPRKENPSDIINEILQGVDGSADVEVIEDRGAAIEKAISTADKGDVVLIAGKGHENFQEFANTTIAFDDRQVAEKALS